MFEEPNYKDEIYVALYESKFQHESWWYFIAKENIMKFSTENHNVSKLETYTSIESIPYQIGYLEEKLPEKHRVEWNKMEWNQFVDDWKVTQIIKSFNINPDKLQVLYNYSSEDEAEWTIYPEPDPNEYLEDAEPSFDFLITGKRNGMESLHCLIRENLRKIKENLN